MSSGVMVSAIGGFRLVAGDLERLTAFYRAIGFVAGEITPIAPAEMAVLGLAGVGWRRPMALGGSHVDLDWFDRPGRSYPCDATACDLVFQHLALVTDDVQTAWRRAHAAGATPITRGGPATLPASSGRVTAMKFRDPEGHPLELVAFPPGGNPAWRGAGMMGIDHSAISIADIAASRRIYEEYGLAPGKRSLNRGPTQVALDGLDGVEVVVLPMNPTQATPHVELLNYRHPARRPHGLMAANDVAATRIVCWSEQEALVRDPDGHLPQFKRKDRSPADILSRR
jgi:catechol 2,3-dioxygenase-like lactoylglutathione lyase family enzyme